MKKFNGFERHLLEAGLGMVMEKMKSDIRKIEEEGKNALMTEGYVDMIGNGTLEKLASLTRKS
jgi:hypothetical protein